MNMLIKSTTNYNLFKTKKGNRPVTLGKARRIADSLKEKNYLPYNPIIVDKKMEVIDGQHRLAAAKIANVPIYYTVIESKAVTLDDIQVINANMSAWRMLDYINSYVSIGNKNYSVYADFAARHSFAMIANIVLLLHPDTLMEKKSDYQDFKLGRFEPTDIEKSEELAEKIESLLDYCHEGVRSSTRFYEAVFHVMRKYPDLLEKLIGRATKKNMIYRVERRVAYTRQFEDIINSGAFGAPIRIV